jgi:hypothetical protein
MDMDMNMDMDMDTLIRAFASRIPHPASLIPHPRHPPSP